MEGASNLEFYSWTQHRRQLCEPVIISENVKEFGIEELELCLGDIYRFERMEIDPVELGWPSRRPRQFVIGVLTDRPAAHSPPSPCDSPSSVVKNLFVRPCEMTQDAYLISTEDEREAERQWAQERPSVMERYDRNWAANLGDSVMRSQIRTFNRQDPRGTFIAALSHNERLRLQAWRESPTMRAGGPGHFTADLGQEPHRAIFSNWD
eukprot:8057200-Pyramimonas_sp.AAC.1